MECALASLYDTFCFPLFLTIYLKFFFKVKCDQLNYHSILIYKAMPPYKKHDNTAFSGVENAWSESNCQLTSPEMRSLSALVEVAYYTGTQETPSCAPFFGNSIELWTLTETLSPELLSGGTFSRKTIEKALSKLNS